MALNSFYHGLIFVALKVSFSRLICARDGLVCQQPIQLQNIICRCVLWVTLTNLEMKLQEMFFLFKFIYQSIFN